MDPVFTHTDTEKLRCRHHSMTFLSVMTDPSPA